MDGTSDYECLDKVTSVIDEPLKFKAKLSIGEDAYTSLRMKNVAVEVWDTLGAVGTGAAVVQSSAVASTFFAPTGVLAAIGIGTAITPIGWIIGAGILSGGAWMGMTRSIKNKSNSHVTVIPNFINTPMDILGVGLFELMAPLAVKLADVDGHIDESEMLYIHEYFIKEWGYNKEFIAEGLLVIERNIKSYSVKELAANLVEFQKHNKDCNNNEMSKDMLFFLNGIMESDGIIDEREEMMINMIENIFQKSSKKPFKLNIRFNAKNKIKVAKERLRKGIVKK